MNEDALPGSGVGTHPESEVGGEHVHRHARALGETDGVRQSHRRRIIGHEIFREGADTGDRGDPVTDGEPGARSRLGDDA